MLESKPPTSTQSIGERLHLLRLSMHWSVEECAYRITIEANAYTSPGVWFSWERCSDQQASENGLLNMVRPISRLFSVDPVWLEIGNNEALADPSGDIIPFPNKPPR